MSQMNGSADSNSGAERRLKKGYVFNLLVKYARIPSEALDRLKSVFVDSQVGDLGL
jgi:hypothetical protein